MWIFRRSAAPSMERSTPLLPISSTEAARARLSTRLFPSRPKRGIRFNTYAGYVADDWKVTDRLTVSLNLRLESYLSPTCDNNCFSRLNSQFTGTPTPGAGNYRITSSSSRARRTLTRNTQPVVWEPRLGIAWRPFSTNNTVIRTGAGIFADELPGGLTENAAFNAPNLNAFTIGNGTVWRPGVPGSLFTTVAQANQTLLSQFASGGTFNSISQSVPGLLGAELLCLPDSLQPAQVLQVEFPGGTSAEREDGVHRQLLRHAWHSHPRSR